MLDIKWLESLELAQREVASTGRLVFLFFHDPVCRGCKKTRSGTFTHPSVVEFISGALAAVNFVVTESQEMTARYNVEWTPTFIIADEHGRELERWVGYLPPEDFVCQLHLSLGLADIHIKRFKEAESAFEWILDHNPNADTAPEARYFMGVALYKDSGDDDHLKRTWEAMNHRYPGNFWTKKASAWSH